MREARTVAAAVAAFLIASGPAFAHSPIEGLEGFYTGILHPFSTAPQLLCVLALAFLLGMASRATVRVAFPAFAVAALAGLAGGIRFGASSQELPIAIVAVLAATLAALVPGRPRAGVIAVAAVAGALIGVLSTPDPGPFRAVLFTGLGAVAGACLAVLYAGVGLVLLLERFRAEWVRIGARVLAAWVAAVSLLMLALMVR
jgi:hydrogenase/urease accessory protein HupE